MTYYRVNKDIHYNRTGYGLIQNELLTEKETQRLAPTIPMGAYTKVEISRKKTHFFFGARFEDGWDYNGKRNS